MMDLAKGLSIGLIVGGLCTMGGSGVAYFKGKAADKQRSDLAILKMVSDADAKFKKADGEWRAKELSWLQATREAESKRYEENQRNAATAADLARTRLERNGLRDQLRAYATGPADPAADSIAACRERAATAGRFVETGLPVQEELAGRAESCAADLRAVLRSWPRN